jgi:hypothetical protein
MTLDIDRLPAEEMERESRKKEHRSILPPETPYWFFFENRTNARSVASEEEV